MVRKPGRMYHAVKGQAYTKKEYMGGVPVPRIARFDDGTLNREFPLQISLVAKEQCQIRHNALEAARVACTKHIANKAGNNYHLKIRIYPHQVLREHKYAVGAGADRISQGMSMSFGVPVGTATRVEKGQRLITLATLKEHFEDAKEALRRARMKLPTPCSIIVES
ncbi:MAG: 50S ribosomal protein L16 [Candidatus Thermoplasmatota archaeon]|nr:50S ribosomal protein L16 [Candidatus Thermoplasmatota archaeon]